MFIKLILALTLFANPALAGGRGGHSTAFDPASYGGNWTTINCTGSDSATIESWRATAAAANPVLATLRLTGDCTVDPDQQITTDVQNVVVWGYGSTITRPYIGAGNPIGITYFISAASAGATSITLQTIGDASNFTVGRWMMVNGLETQAGSCGFPPNPYFFDYVLVTAINGATISFTPALTNNYLTTWPLVCTGRGSGDGPAGANPMSASWNTNVQVFGLTIRDSGQAVIVGRAMQMTDVTAPTGGFDPTASDSISFNYSNFTSSEIDKIIGNLSFNRSFGSFMNFQNSSIKQTIFANSGLSGRGIGLADMQGTPANISISNSTIPVLWIGPNGNGVGNTILVDGLSVNSVLGAIEFISVSALSFSGGTFSILKSDPNAGTFLALAVPGFKYTYGEASTAFLDNPSIPSSVFTITAVREDATKYYWDTNIVGTPSPTCGGSPCSKIIPYPGVVTQKFTGPATLVPWSTPYLLKRDLEPAANDNSPMWLDQAA